MTCPLSPLHQEPSWSSSNLRVLAIVAVPEVASVVVSTWNGLHMVIWCFEDRLEGGELVIQEMLDNPDFPPVFQLCKVILPDGTIEVWGTSDHNKLAVLQHCSQGGEHAWQTQFYESQFPNGATLPCKCITHAHFVDAAGVLHDHIWVSTDRRCRLVCWDAQEKKQLHVTEVKRDLELGACEVLVTPGAMDHWCVFEVWCCGSGAGGTVLRIEGVWPQVCNAMWSTHTC